MKLNFTLLGLLLAFGFAASASTLPKNDIFQTDTLKKGKNYILFSKSEQIDNVFFSKAKKPKEQVLRIHFGYPTPIPTSNTISSNVISAHKKKDNQLPVFDKIDIISGNYKDIKVERETDLKNLFTFTDLQFPLRLKLTSGKDTLDLELTEAGEWDIRIDLKNN